MTDVYWFRLLHRHDTLSGISGPPPPPQMNVKWMYLYTVISGSDYSTEPTTLSHLKDILRVSSQFDKEKFTGSSHQRHKRSVSREHYVETMVVADSHMLAKYGKGLQHYILTLMSIVSVMNVIVSDTVQFSLASSRRYRIVHNRDHNLYNKGGPDSLPSRCQSYNLNIGCLIYSRLNWWKPIKKETFLDVTELIMGSNIPHFAESSRKYSYPLYLLAFTFTEFQE